MNILALIVILFLLLMILGVFTFFKNKKVQKAQKISFPKMYDPADDWTAADWEAYNFHSDCGDR